MRSPPKIPLKFLIRADTAPISLLILMEMHTRISQRESCVQHIRLLAMMTLASLSVGLLLAMFVESRLVLAVMLLSSLVVTAGALLYECKVLPRLRAQLAPLPAEHAGHLSVLGEMHSPVARYLEGVGHQRREPVYGEYLALKRMCRRAKK